LLADKIEAHHPHGMNDNVRKLKQWEVSGQGR
jgi:hypothetical protein